MNFNLTCGKGVTELQNLANLCLSSFAESQQMQQKNFDVSPYKSDVTVSLMPPNDFNKFINRYADTPFSY